MGKNKDYIYVQYSLEYIYKINTNFYSKIHSFNYEYSIYDKCIVYFLDITIDLISNNKIKLK